MAENIDVLELEFQKMNDAEISAFTQFQRKFAVLYPPPKKENPSLTWEFWSSIVVALSGVSLAAFRTGDAFYQAAVYGGSPLFALSEAIVAVVAIEGVVVLTAVRNAYRSRSNSEINGVALWIALIISGLAGLFQSVGLIETIADSWLATLLNYSLVIAMGLGATTIAALAGHDLGVRLVVLEQERLEANKRFADANRSYRANLLKQWRASSELGSVDKAKHTRYDRQTNEQVTNERSTHSSTNKPNRPVRLESNNERRDKIYGILDTVLESHGLIATVSHVAEELAKQDAKNPNDLAEISELKNRYKGYVSQVRRKWMTERGVEEKKPDGAG